MDKKKLIIGVIGADVHAVGISILQHAFEDAGFDVTNLGVMVSQEEYISAAIETGADAISVLSLWSRRAGLPWFERQMQRGWFKGYSLICRRKYRCRKTAI